MIVGFYDFEDNPELLVQIKELANRDPKSSFANLIKESIETLSTNKARKEKNRVRRCFLHNNYYLFIFV